MSDKPRVGFVGVGLMGWGMAKNIVEKGFPLRVIAHRKREAVEDLVTRGAEEVTSLKAMAERSDIVVLCVTGSPEVEATVEGLLQGARPGLVILDSSTSEPAVTERLAASLAEQQISFVDAPLSKTPAHAWEGDLSTYVGGPPELIERLRPLLETWATTIIPVGGPVGSAIAIKLINNLVGIGYAAIWAECYAMVRKVGVKPAVFRQIVSSSGLNCNNFQSFSKYICDGDPNAHKFALSNCLKDLTYYNRIANDAGAATLMSDGALQTLKLANAMGFEERYMAELVDVVARLNSQAEGPASD